MIGDNEVEGTENTRILTYERGAGTPIEDDLLTALEHVGINPWLRDPPLLDLVDPDTLDNLEWENPHLEVNTFVWGHPIQITAEEIRILSSE